MEHYEGELSKKDVKVSLNKMENKKIPGNDGVTKLFLKMFQLEIKSQLLLTFKKGFFLTGKLSTSQKVLGKKTLGKLPGP